MRYLLTDTEMRQADEYAIQGLGKSVLELMENAGLALANKAEEISPSGKILCVCGGGNNGGDGFVAARILKSRGREVDLLCIAEKFSTPCKMNMDKWRETGEVLTQIPQKKYSLILDSLFGTGLTRAYPEVSIQVCRPASFAALSSSFVNEARYKGSPPVTVIPPPEVS